MNGKLIVISAPSGAGKTTVIKRLLAKAPDLVLSVSYTTRKRRASEKDRVDYIFVSEEEFRRAVDNNEMLEWAVVHGNRYGTPSGPVKEWLEKGRTVILDVDTEGAGNVKKSFPDAILIFLLPPPLQELEKRLIKRGEKKGQGLETRLKNSEIELKKIDSYDHQVPSGELDNVVEMVGNIINAKA